MISYTRAALIVDIAFNYSCEYCDTMGQTSKPVSGTGFALFHNKQGARKNAVKNLQQKVDRIQKKLDRKAPSDLQLVWHAECPSCGYIQSWSLRYVRGRRLQQVKISLSFIAVICLILPLFTGFWSPLLLLPLPLAALLFIYTQMIYHPNEGWLKQHGYTIDTPPAPRAPLQMSVREYHK